MLSWLARNLGWIALLTWAIIPHWQFDPWVHLLLAVAVMHMLYAWFKKLLPITAR